MSYSKNSTESSAGFLDGYMAGNISANAGELKAHTDKIHDFLHTLKGTFDGLNGGIPPERKHDVLESIDKFESRSMGNNPDPDDYYNYSLSLSEIMSKIKSSFPLDQLPTESNYLIKRTIYHFLNIAKTLKDERVIQEATKIAGQFK